MAVLVPQDRHRGLPVHNTTAVLLGQRVHHRRLAAARWACSMRAAFQCQLCCKSCKQTGGALCVLQRHHGAGPCQMS